MAEDWSSKTIDDLDPELRQRVEECVRIACLDEFIAKLPEGYSTFVGERASKLSGGEQQRLAIARALMRHAPVLILDEPTSALDAPTENKLMANLRELACNRILFVVTHRLATIRNADQICFVRDGQILETGTDQELMSIPEGHYRQFCEAQYQTASTPVVAEEAESSEGVTV